MQPDDLLVPPKGALDQPLDEWGGSWQLRYELLNQMIEAPLDDESDISVASSLVRLVHSELEAHGTSGAVRLPADADLQLLVRAATRVCSRVGVDFPRLPFRTYQGFYKYWVANDMKGSWAARRDYLDATLGPVEDQLFDLETRSWEESLAQAVSPHSDTGWTDVDREIQQLRRKFEVARTDQDHSAVGVACVRILEFLGEAAFDAQRHLPATEPVPARDATKLRFDLIIAAELQGSESAEVRKLARSTVELAQKIKHRPTPSRRDAGIAADSTIILVNIVRRLVLG